MADRFRTSDPCLAAFRSFAYSVPHALPAPSTIVTTHSGQPGAKSNRSQRL